MVEISKDGFWRAYEKMNEFERKAWLEELRENLLVDDNEPKAN